jgi:Resolvase, N terminal domain
VCYTVPGGSALDGVYKENTVRLIAYRRVSTARQGTSGLGLEAREAAIAAYARVAGAMLLRAYTEVETGTRSDRPELARALADCKRSRARLVIAKLDRLARNARLLLTLIESGVDGAFCDLPSVPPRGGPRRRETRPHRVPGRAVASASNRRKATIRSAGWRYRSSRSLASIF